MTHIGKNGPRIYYNINMFRPTQPNTAQFFVETKNDHKDLATTRIIGELRPMINRIPGARIELKELEQGPQVGAPIAIKIKGDDLDILRRFALAYKALLETISGSVDISDDASEIVAQIDVNVDSDKARLLGITNATIARTMRTAIYGTSAGSFRQKDEEVDVVVSLDDASRNRGQRCHSSN
jgi:multidrug efflux pump subunit AcrB